jgi:hypothetical protein
LAGNSIPKQASGTTSAAVLKIHKVELIFQKYPGTDAQAAIRGLEYEVKIGSGPARKATLGNDGKIIIRIPAGQYASVKIMGTEYKIRRQPVLKAKNTLKGVQQRLNLLGYNAGYIDGIMGPKTEYAVLNYQADNNPLRVDGLPGPNTQNSLETKVGE